jgi:small subunit ribosomal protein S20
MPEEKKEAKAKKPESQAPAGAVKSKVKKRKPSVLKNIRQTKRKHEHNMVIKTNLKSILKQVNAAINSKNKEKTKELLNPAFSALDKAARKNIIHANKAARFKSRLSKKAGALLAA